jgi:hypothetical protein
MQNAEGKTWRHESVAHAGRDQHHALLPFGTLNSEPTPLNHFSPAITCNSSRIFAAICRSLQPITAEKGRISPVFRFFGGGGFFANFDQRFGSARIGASTVPRLPALPDPGMPAYVRPGPLPARPACGIRPHMSAYVRLARVCPHNFFQPCQLT